MVITVYCTDACSCIRMMKRQCREWSLSSEMDRQKDQHGEFWVKVNLYSSGECHLLQ